MREVHRFYGSEPFSSFTAHYRQEGHMRTFPRICAALLAACVADAPAFAQAATDKTAEPARWDFNLSAGFFESRPFGTGSRFSNDDWYGEGRYAASIGFYWTEHLKTELEFAHTGEGRRWTQELVRVPGTSTNYPIGTETAHRLQQTSARLVWQFNENAWVHPYINGGFVFDAERRTSQSPAQFYYPGDPRTQPPILVRPEMARNGVMEYRAGVTVGGGAKFYMSPNTYLNTGLQVTYAKPATTASFLAGFGVDF
jgi:hypothetical protein